MDRPQWIFKTKILVTKIPRLKVLNYTLEIETHVAQLYHGLIPLCAFQLCSLC